MSRSSIAILLCWTLVGCAADGNVLSRLKDRFRGHKDTADEAVLVTDSNGAPGTDSSRGKGGGVVAAGASQQLVAPAGQVAESIIARVNGDVILAQDVYNPIRGALGKAQQEMPASQFQQYSRMMVEKQLRDLVDRQLLLQEAKRNLPEPMVKRLEAAADKEFGKRIESEMKRMEVNTESELRRKLLETGESLDQIREFQRGSFVAQQYLRFQLDTRLQVSREEMVDYYNLHRDEFKQDGGVVWSEILVSTEKSGSREAALAKAQEIVMRLRDGADFAEVAKAESEGATAPDGGRWDMTTKGSYIVKSVDEELFRLPARKVSDPLEGPKGWHIVRVEEKRNGGETSFVDAQEEIRKKIREQKITKESQRYVQELVAKAHITTIFDKQDQPKSGGERGPLGPR
jgi:peptidyl-prolyl cis-trans isomerase SurA